MQEKEVTVAKETLPLPSPFFVLATQNPLETRDVYPLPEAQLDRFLMKVKIGYTSKIEETKIADSNMEVKDFADFDVKPVVTLKDILNIREVVKKIYISHEVKKYIVNIVNATRHPKKYGLKEARLISCGASPRASINIAFSARATALMAGRVYVTPDDVRSVAFPVLRHRLILSYEGKAAETITDDLIDAIIKIVPVM